MDKKIIATAAALGGLAVILGAFGAHGLKAIVSPGELAAFETGVRYQMYHALFLFFVASTTLISARAKNTIFWLVTVGVLLFSGSIYVLSTASATGIQPRFLGPVTPLGGLLLIAAWVVLFAKIMGRKAE